MNWGIGKRQKSAARGTGSFVLPAVVLEVEPEFVAAARLEGSARRGRSVRHLGVRALDIATLTAHPSRSNVANADHLRQAVEEALEAIGNGSGRVGLIVPDRAVRAGTLSFETLPDNHDEAAALVRWRMRENLPFAPDEARISFQVVSREAGHTEVFAIAARASILGEYEVALGASNGAPVLTLPATAALLPLLPERNSTQLLIHACSGWVTTVIVAGRQVYSWRTRELAQDAAENWPREVASESARAVASIRDRQQIEIARAWLCARPPAEGELVADLKRELGCEIDMIAPPRELAGTLSGEERSLYEHFGAPVAGLVVNSAKNP
jgi:hypothetical protein